MLKKSLIFLASAFSFSFPVKIKTECFRYIDKVLYCKSILTKQSLVPQNCGKCELSINRGRLIIKKAKSCVKYDVWACQLSSGEFFLIDNFSCKPKSWIETKKKQENKTKVQENADKEKRLYRVKVMGEYCFSLLRRKFDVVKEDVSYAIIKASPSDIKNLPHCVYSYEEE